jgi:hypothetical protein
MATPPDGVLVYRSRYGTTLQYAEWIKKELRIPKIEPERLDDQVLAASDFLVIGTPVYQGEMLIRDWLEQNEQRLHTKRLFLFIVCLHFTDAEKRQQMITDNIPDGLLSGCELYFLPGRLVVENLSAEDARFMDTQGPPPITHVTAERIRPLVASVREYGAM